MKPTKENINQCLESISEDQKAYILEMDKILPGSMKKVIRDCRDIPHFIDYAKYAYKLKQIFSTEV